MRMVLGVLVSVLISNPAYGLDTQNAITTKLTPSPEFQQMTSWMNSYSSEFKHHSQQGIALVNSATPGDPNIRAALVGHNMRFVQISEQYLTKLRAIRTADPKLQSSQKAMSAYVDNVIAYVESISNAVNTGGRPKDEFRAKAGSKAQEAMKLLGEYQAQKIANHN